MPLMKGRERACEMSGGTNLERGASAWEEQNSDGLWPDIQLSERSKKEIPRGEFNLLPSGRTSPEHRHNKRCWFVVWGAGKRATKRQQGEQHRIKLVGDNPNLPPAGAEDSCPHPRLGAPYPRPGTLPATRPRHVLRSKWFALWPLLNFKK